MSKPSAYNEDLLHWIWKNRHLSGKDFSTTDEKTVHIHHPGYANPTDGPDFKNARITIGSLMWHGDVEIHWTGADWFGHHHHTDKNYNRVILHLVFDGAKKPAKRQDQTAIPTLRMKPFLSKPLQYFFHHFQKTDRLPCAGNLADIPEKVLSDQFEEAHQQYFEKKVDDLLHFYDPSLPLSKAWERLLIIALFDGLGIRHNRDPMHALAKQLLEHENFETKADLIQHAMQLSGIGDKDSASSFNWKRKNSRPANHPKARIPQACSLMWTIQQMAFKTWLKGDIDSSLKKLIASVKTAPALGKSRARVLKGTVWIPAFYILGDLAGTRLLTTKAHTAWKNYRMPIPNSISKHFKNTKMPSNIYANKLGTVHQYRAYCRPRNCQQCKVFDHIISS